MRNIKRILDPRKIKIKVPKSKPKPKGSKTLEEARKADRDLRRMKMLKQVANLGTGIGLYMYGSNSNEAKDSSKKPVAKKNNKLVPKTKLASAPVNKSIKGSNKTK